MYRGDLFEALACLKFLRNRIILAARLFVIKNRAHFFANLTKDFFPFCSFIIIFLV